jgi:hypothetical protein
MKDFRRGTDPDPSDGFGTIVESPEETVAPRPRLVPEKVLDRCARSLDRLLLRPVAGAALLGRVLDDLTFDELRDFRG